LKLTKDNNLFTLLKENADSFPDLTFFVFENRHYTYKEALGYTQSLAHYLRENGIEPGHRILINLGNIPEFIFSFLACAQLGAVSVLVNPDAKRFELDYIILNSTPSMIITSESKLQDFKIEGQFIFPANRILLHDSNKTDNLITKIIKKNNRHEKYEKLEIDHPVSIIYTSAMDGLPAGAMLTHNGIFSTIRIMNQYALEQERYLSVLPLFHSFGLTTTFLLPLSYSQPFYLMNSFSPAEIIRILQEAEITAFMGVPIMFRVLSTFLPEGSSLPALRVCISGGEAISADLQQELLDRHDINIRQGYGLTEASPIITWNNMNIENRFGSTGKPMEWNTIRIIKENNEEAGSGESGEIQAKGTNIIKGYYNSPEITEKYLKDGWLKTGDIGYLDTNKYLFITGRKKNMALKLGLNVYPEEVSRILMKHPLISEAKVSSTIIRKDDMTTKESIEATVYTKGKTLTQESLKIWCRENISGYKIPKKFIIR